MRTPRYPDLFKASASLTRYVTAIQRPHLNNVVLVMNEH